MLSILRLLLLGQLLVILIAILLVVFLNVVLILDLFKLVLIGLLVTLQGHFDLFSRVVVMATLAQRACPIELIFVIVIVVFIVRSLITIFRPCFNALSPC